jgi:hypothetical protein
LNRDSTPDIPQISRTGSSEASARKVRPSRVDALAHRIAESGLEVGVAFSPDSLEADGSWNATPQGYALDLRHRDQRVAPSLSTHRVRRSDLGGGTPPVLGHSTPGRA